MPMMGLPKSSSPKPTARSIARLGARWTPSVMAELRSGEGRHGNVVGGSVSGPAHRKWTGVLGALTAYRSPLTAYRSGIVVQEELVRMRPQVDRRDVLGPLHGDPGVQHVGREDVALEQELVVGLERGHRLGQGAGHHLDARLALVVQLVEVLVDRRRLL